MSLEENKAIVRRWIETYNKHNLDSFDEFIAPDYIDHTNKLDRESLKQMFNMGFKAFPDWHETIEDIVAEGDKVWVRLTYTGTHEGEFFGVAPSGKKITGMSSIDIYRIADGKLVEYWNVRDSLEFAKQMGGIEYTEEGKKLFPDVE